MDDEYLFTFLTDMRREMNDKFENVIQTQSDLNTRVVVIENTHKTVRWIAGTMIVAVLGFVMDMVTNHVPNFIKRLTQ